MNNSDLVYEIAVQTPPWSKKDVWSVLEFVDNKFTQSYGPYTSREEAETAIKTICKIVKAGLREEVR